MDEKDKKELIELLNEASEEIQNLYGNETDLSERLWNKAEEIGQLNWDLTEAV